MEGSSSVGTETALAIIVALLWGPTAIWLIVRASRGGEQRHFESDHPGHVPSASLRLEQDLLASLAVEAEEQWVCGGCRSLNRRDAKRCYSCRESREGSDVPVRMARPQRPLVPVMADASEPSNVVPGSPAGVASLTASPGPTVERPRLHVVGVPVMEDVIAVEPEAPSGLPVCPFLGLERDPTTWFDFPAPGNVCHATPSRRSSLVQSIEGMVPGNRRKQTISMVHQGAACLAVAHVACQRYAAAGGASRMAIQARAAAIPPVVPRSSPPVVTPEPDEELPTPVMATVVARPASPPVAADQTQTEAPKPRRAKRSR